MRIKKNISLKNHSTFKIGGPAKFFCTVRSVKNLEKALAWANENSERYFILGGGSNVLFSDQGFDGLVIKINNDDLGILKEKHFEEFGIEKKENKVYVRCGAGVGLTKLVIFLIRKGLTGLEWASIE